MDNLAFCQQDTKGAEPRSPGVSVHPSKQWN